MSRDLNRFASDDVATLASLTVQATATARLSNPRGLPIDPARLVAVVDGLLEEALEELPLVLWEAEETIRFELAEARVLLALSEGTHPGEAGLTLGLAAMGPDCEAIARGLCDLVAHALLRRFPDLEPLPGPDPAHDALIEADVAGILAQPFAASPMPLPPVDTLVDQVWRRASVEAAEPRTAVPRKPLTWPQRLLAWARPPQIAPMRQPVRALALVLFLMGLAMGPLGQTASAGTSATTGSRAP